MLHRSKSVMVLFVLALRRRRIGRRRADGQRDLPDVPRRRLDSRAANGQKVAVDPDHFGASVHAGLGCVDCHAQVGNYDDAPHYQRYQPVNCAECHEDAVKSHAENFHHRARAAGNTKAPTCASCHGVGGDPHRLHPLDSRTAEESCRTCHAEEAKIYDTGVHAVKVAGGRERAGCITCHQSHGPGLPPAAGAVNQLCEKCHPGAMAAVQRGGHMALGEQMNQALNCASCHDSHAHAQAAPLAARGAGLRHLPRARSTRPSRARCTRSCWPPARSTACRATAPTRTRRRSRASTAVAAPATPTSRRCTASSVHRFGRLRGSEGAATCADCHGGHTVLAASDTTSATNPKNIPQTCGKCHGAEAVITSDFVRLPITLPNYLNSVHGNGWKAGQEDGGLHRLPRHPRSADGAGSQVQGQPLPDRADLRQVPREGIAAST